MNIQFIKVFPDELNKIDSVFNILQLCGSDMYENQGLTHWKTPYEKERIVHDCKTKEVYLGVDMEQDAYVHTFQIAFHEKTANICKLATLPAESGKGIASKSMRFIEDICKQRNIGRIILDVYEKSLRAIKFYEKNGFVITSSSPTKYFTVYNMEKRLS